MSPYRGDLSVLKIGAVIKSNRNNNKLTAYELESETVNKGIHLWQNIKAAKNDISTWSFYYKYVIVKVSYEPNDFVATGTFSGFNPVVVTKMTILEIIPYTPKSRD